MLMERQPPPPIDDDDAEAGCKLMDSFAIFIQLCLAAAAFSTLIIKRQREQPQRPVRIWAFDVSKQLVGGIVVHSLNVVASYFSGGSLEGQQANPCVWYFLNILVDTTLGVGILWAILSAFQYVLIDRLQLSGFQSGVYGDPPLQKQLKQWSKQLAVYIASLILMKLIVVLLFHLCPWLSDLGRWVLGWTMGNYKLQVVFVMLIFPLVMNIIQFWVVDTIVKHKTAKKAIRLSQDEGNVEDMLITDDEDEDYDDDARNRFANASSPFLNRLAGSSTNIVDAQLPQKIPNVYDSHDNVASSKHPKEDTMLASPQISPSPSGHSLHELDSSDVRRTS